MAVAWNRVFEPQSGITYTGEPKKGVGERMYLLYELNSNFIPVLNKPNDNNTVYIHSCHISAEQNPSERHKKSCHLTMEFRDPKTNYFLGRYHIYLDHHGEYFDKHYSKDSEQTLFEESSFIDSLIEDGNLIKKLQEFFNACYPKPTLAHESKMNVEERMTREAGLKGGAKCKSGVKTKKISFTSNFASLSDRLQGVAPHRNHNKPSKTILSKQSPIKVQHVCDSLNNGGLNLVLASERASPGSSSESVAQSSATPNSVTPTSERQGASPLFTPSPFRMSPGPQLGNQFQSIAFENLRRSPENNNGRVFTPTIDAGIDTRFSLIRKPIVMKMINKDKSKIIAQRFSMA